MKHSAAPALSNEAFPDPSILAIENWRQSNRLYSRVHEMEEETGVISPTPESESAFDDMMGALDTALAVAPRTLAGVLAFLTMMREVDLHEDADRLGTALSTLSVGLLSMV